MLTNVGEANRRNERINEMSFLEAVASLMKIFIPSTVYDKKYE